MRRPVANLLLQDTNDTKQHNDPRGTKVEEQSKKNVPPQAEDVVAGGDAGRHDERVDQQRVKRVAAGAAACVRLGAC